MYQGTNAAPTPGQANPYTLCQYDGAGRMTRRERRQAGGIPRVVEFKWDGDNRLRQALRDSASVFTASYDGDGLRVGKWDAWTGTHNYSWGPGGLLHEDNGSTIHTPGLAFRRWGGDQFSHGDWLGSTRCLSDGTGNNFPTALQYALGQRPARHCATCTPDSW